MLSQDPSRPWGSGGSERPTPYPYPPNPFAKTPGLTPTPVLPYISYNEPPWLQVM